MPGGRPTKYQASFCDVVVEAGKQGKSVAWIAAELEVSKQSIYEWIEVHPEFSDAMDRARALAQRWWEDKGQEGMEQQGFNASIWSRSMAARFPDDWRDVKAQEISGPDGGPLSVSWLPTE